jgi:hypothetical protein
MKIEAIPNNVLEAVRKRGYADERITKMSARKLFAEFCNWHGLINWGESLFDVALVLQELDSRKEEVHR